MKISFHSIGIVYIFLYGFVPLFAQVQVERFDAYQLLYNNNLQQIEKNHMEEVANLSERYVQRLDSLVEYYQSRGNLAGVLQVKEEQNVVNTGEPFPLIPEGEFKELSTIRSKYTGALEPLNQDRDSKINKLRGAYLNHLKNMTAELTRENRIEEAVLVQNEVERIENGIKQTVPGQDPNAGVADETATEIFWGAPHNDYTMMVKTPDEEKSPDMQVIGNITLEQNGYVFKGGKVRVPVAGEALIRAVKNSGQLSFQFMLTAESLKPKGATTIFSCAFAPDEGVLTLCQQEDRLLLRIRSSDSLEDGSRTELDLGPLKKGKRTKVAFSYDGKETICFRDGEQIPLEGMKGDFSTWESFPMVLGSEIKVQRVWFGTIHGFKFSNRALKPEVVKAASQ